MKNKNFWILLLLLLAGIVLGGVLGEATKSISLLSWLNFGQSFGLDTPLVLNGHHLWTDYSHYHGQHHRRGHCAFDLSLSVGVCD